MRILSRTSLASLALIQGTFAAAAPAQPQRDAIEACITTAAADLSFNGNVYARLGDVVIQKSFGTSDAGGRIPITADTRFNVASAGKMITAAAIGLLVDRLS